jgi:hypothetical protein
MPTALGESPGYLIEDRADAMSLSASPIWRKRQHRDDQYGQRRGVSLPRPLLQGWPSCLQTEPHELF